MRIGRRGLIIGGTIGASVTAAGLWHAYANVPPLAAAAPEPPPTPLPVVAATVPAAPIAAPAPPPPPVVAEVPRWMRYAVTPPSPDGRPIITVVIDDMGVTHAYTDRAVALKGPLTLSWFPFAHRLAEQIEVATARGHETLLHMPMQSNTNSIAQTGPDPLRIDLPPEVNLALLRAAIDTIPNAVGLNNHMGTVATRDVALMNIVAAETKSRGMLFMDSLTISHSVALSQARLAQVPSVARDVFIDNSNGPAQIRQQLELIEREARNNGRVVAIGHPRHATLDALEAWLPTLERKGFVLWPLAATVVYENRLAIPGGVTV